MGVLPVGIESSVAARAPHSSLHVSNCPKHPVAMYRRALDGLVAAVEEVAASLAQAGPEHSAAALLEAAGSARRAVAEAPPSGQASAEGFSRADP